jgi:hypothetical protein
MNRSRLPAWFDFSRYADMARSRTRRSYLTNSALPGVSAYSEGPRAVRVITPMMVPLTRVTVDARRVDCGPGLRFACFELHSLSGQQPSR